MGRRRKTEHHLPRRVYLNRGWHWFVDDAGKWYKLGKEWDRAAKDTWVKLTEGKAAHGTVSELLDAYLEHAANLVRQGKRSKQTYDGNLGEAQTLKLVFGRMGYAAVTSKHVASFLRRRTDKAGKPAPVRANREAALLSSAYSWAMGEPGFDVTLNPCYGVRRNTERPRERCPEMWELDAVKAKANEQWRAIVDLAYITGQRGVTLRLLTKDRLRDAGIDFGTTKRGRPIFIEWDDDLRACITTLQTITAKVCEERKTLTPYLIVNRYGQPYGAQGWKGTFYKLVRAAIADGENPLKSAFHFHDIRAKSATDEDEAGGNPQHRLGHRTRAQTADYLRSKSVVRVKALPLKRGAG